MTGPPIIGPVPQHHLRRSGPNQNDNRGVEDGSQNVHDPLGVTFTGEHLLAEATPRWRRWLAYTGLGGAAVLGWLAVLGGAASASAAPVPQPPAPEAGYTYLVWSRPWAPVIAPYDTGYAKSYTTTVHLDGEGLEFCWVQAPTPGSSGSITVTVAGTPTTEGGVQRACVQLGLPSGPPLVGTQRAQVAVSYVSALAFKLWEEPPPAPLPKPPPTIYVNPSAGGGVPDLPYVPYPSYHHHDYDHWWDWF